jgi:hypothetical protein
VYGDKMLKTLDDVIFHIEIGFEETHEYHYIAK